MLAYSDTTSESVTKQTKNVTMHPQPALSAELSTPLPQVEAIGLPGVGSPSEFYLRVVVLKGSSTTIITTGMKIGRSQIGVLRKCTPSVRSVWLGNA